MKRISIIVPCYNEEGCLYLLYDRLRKIMDENINYMWEVLMIDDGSRDSTLEIIKTLHSNDERICYLSLSRNFGKENAMLAGFDAIRGGLV